MKFRACCLAAWGLILASATPAAARTILLTDIDCERMAFIQASAPRWSWGGYEVEAGTQTSSQFYFYKDKAFLICYPVDRIPKGQRIISAELEFTTAAQNQGEQKLFLRRIAADWGPGICWQYRYIRPERKEWNRPGGTGAGTDRIAQPSAIIRSTEGGVKRVNVTRDVELWYTGAAPNHGWMLTLEDPVVYVLVSSPLWTGRGTWKLRVTYEPE